MIPGYRLELVLSQSDNDPPPSCCFETSNYSVTVAVTNEGKNLKIRGIDTEDE
jgi:hypothetical protein